MYKEIEGFKFIELPRIIDGRDGIISVAEQNRNIPFSIKRVYYIYDLKSDLSVRGMHAHKSLEQVLFCVNGRFELIVDDGYNKNQFKMDTPNLGIYLGPMLWHEMRKFSENCILLVLASDYFNEDDYIRDYSEFLSFIRQKR